MNRPRDEPRDPPEPSNPSRARDHMANERTYLAWLRTVVTVMALGLAVAKLGEVSTTSILAGCVLVVVGAAGAAYGTVRYRQVNRELETGRYTTGSRGRAAVIASVVLVTAIVAALALLVAGGS